MTHARVPGRCLPTRVTAPPSRVKWLASSPFLDPLQEPSGLFRLDVYLFNSSNILGCSRVGSGLGSGSTGDYASLFRHIRVAFFKTEELENGAD